jgi:hypothetical protein
MVYQSPLMGFRWAEIHQIIDVVKVSCGKLAECEETRWLIHEV